MAGDIWLTDELRWPVSNSLYHWVLDFLINAVDEPPTRTRLEEIRDANLGIIDAGDFDPDARTRIITALRHDLLADARDRLPADLPNREGFITALRELTTLADRTPVRAGRPGATPRGGDTHDRDTHDRGASGDGG